MPYLKMTHYYWLMLSAFFGLFALLMLWHTVLAPSTRFPVALLLLLNVTPLLMPLHGMLNGNKKSCAWMAYLSLFYFIQGAIECYANADERYYAALEVFLSLQLFFGAAFYVRTFNHTSSHA